MTGRFSSLVPLAAALGLAVVLSACGPVPKASIPVTTVQPPETPPEADEERGFQEEGMGTWYGPGLHGRRTASGEKFDQNALTAAHRTLPFDTLVEVRNLETNRTVVVRINDRGPFADGYIIDLSRGAARQVGMLSSTPVSIRVVDEPPKAETAAP